MLKSRQPVELSGLRSADLDELSGLVKRPGPALHVKLDGHRVVERRATELRRLQRQFSGLVARPSRYQDDALESWRSETYVPAQQRWCTRLDRDVRAVCSEAGLSAAAADAVTRAARRGGLPQNPGVLLSRLLRFQDCLGPPLGRRGVLTVLRAAPSLLRYSPESLRWNVDMLSALLPDGAAVAAAVQRAPMLLGASAITVWGNFEGLRGLLRLDHDAALRLVIRAPRLLLNSRGALEGRLEALALLAGGGGGACGAAAAAAVRRRVAAVVARQPALLGYFPGTLERNLRAVAAALGVPFERVQPLLLKQPALVMLARGSLRDRVAALRDAIGLFDGEELASAVLRQPSLLTLSPDSVRRKVGAVASVLGLEGAPGELSAVLRGAPQLLTLAEDSVRSKAAALRTAVAPCGALRAQLERAPPQTVALWLCLSATRYEHVRTVAELAAAQGACAMGPEAAGEEPGAPTARRRGRPRRVVQTGPLDVEQLYLDRLRSAGVVDEVTVVRRTATATEVPAAAADSTDGSVVAAAEGAVCGEQPCGGGRAAAEAAAPAAGCRTKLSLYTLLRDGGKGQPPRLAEPGVLVGLSRVAERPRARKSSPCGGGGGGGAPGKAEMAATVTEGPAADLVAMQVPCSGEGRSGAYGSDASAASRCASGSGTGSGSRLGTRHTGSARVRLRVVRAER